MRIILVCAALACAAALLTGCETLSKKTMPDSNRRAYGSYSWWNNRMNESQNGRQMKGNFGDSGESFADYGLAEESGFEF